MYFDVHWNRKYDTIMRPTQIEMIMFGIFLFSPNGYKLTRQQYGMQRNVIHGSIYICKGNKYNNIVD